MMNHALMDRRWSATAAAARNIRGHISVFREVLVGGVVAVDIFAPRDLPFGITSRISRLRLGDDEAVALSPISANRPPVCRLLSALRRSRPARAESDRRQAVDQGVPR